MSRLLALAAAALALLAWLNLRDLLRRASYEQVTDPADDVQPPDPVTRYFMHFTPVTGGSWTVKLPPVTSDNLDLTYTDAITRAAIRRTAQRDDVSTGGM